LGAEWKWYHRVGEGKELGLGNSQQAPKAKPGLEKDQDPDVGPRFKI
jgi:hypothetical protein